MLDEYPNLSAYGALSTLNWQFSQTSRPSAEFPMAIYCLISTRIASTSSSASSECVTGGRMSASPVFNSEIFVVPSGIVCYTPGHPTARWAISVDGLESRRSYAET